MAESAEKFSGSREHIVARTEPSPFLITTLQFKPLTSSSTAATMASNCVKDMSTNWKVSKPYALKSERVPDNCVYPEIAYSKYSLTDEGGLSKFVWSAFSLKYKYW